METNITNQAKTRIYNLIILDQSGSMHSIEKAAYEGCNEVLEGIREAALKHADEQEQLVSLLLFDSQAKTYIHRCTPAKEACNLSEGQYRPCACTPLLDAMGESLTELERELDQYEDAVGMVTIITDGYENASTHYSYSDIHTLVGRLKEKGWNFAFMGANQDVSKVCISLNINITNAHEFAFSDAGMRQSWYRDRAAKERYYERMRKAREESAGISKEDREKYYYQMNEQASYFEDDHAQRIAPYHISHLKQNEIFVFGSNADGVHSGGAAAYAMQHFGAIWGEGEGLQGKSYAIPTIGGIDKMKQAIERFTEFAQKHPELRFMVTAIGCGIAGYSARQVAPMFQKASTLQNVYLPAAFWKAL